MKNFINKIIKIFLKFTYLNLRLNKELWIYFPNKQKFYKVIVSGLLFNHFLVKFVNNGDLDDSDAMNYCDILDNDIKIDYESYVPIKKK